MKQASAKVALVTGGAKNLGQAITLDLARQGYQVAIHYHHSKKQAQQTLAQVQRHTNGVIVSANLTQPQEIATMFHLAEQQLGVVDVLVNLVGNFIFEPITTTTFEAFKDVIETNLYATFLCCKQALPGMQQNQWGRIINFANVGADTLTIREKTTPYFIAKTGVLMLTKVFAHEYAGSGITVNSISPGVLATSVTKPPTPTGTFIQFKDVVNAINFLLKPESQSINGANIEVAAGFRLGFSS